MEKQTEICEMLKKHMSEMQKILEVASLQEPGRNKGKFSDLDLQCKQQHLKDYLGNLTQVILNGCEYIPISLQLQEYSANF